MPFIPVFLFPYQVSNPGSYTDFSLYAPLVAFNL